MGAGRRTAAAGSDFRGEARAGEIAISTTTVDDHVQVYNGGFYY
jgi:hypothetical protein